MKISKAHRKFSKRLNQRDALTNPEKYLGPNWEDVLNFWIYVDTLSDQDKIKMDHCYDDISRNMRVSAIIAANVAAEEVVYWEFRNAACDAVWDVTGRAVFESATCELIGSHKLLEQNKPLTFLPLCIKT